MLKPLGTVNSLEALVYISTLMYWLKSFSFTDELKLYSVNDLGITLW
jgi:hypothetical protein